MRILLVSAVAMLAAAALPVQGGHGPVVLLNINDGDFFYDQFPNDGVCQGNTDNNLLGVATRHWHVGLPWVGGEPLGGFGCLGAPKTVTVTVSPGHQATGAGSIRYTWDKDVAGGGFNDVQLHITNAMGVLVYSSVISDGPKPVVPNVLQVQTHAIAFTLDPGTYTLREDIWSGEHTAWLTKLTVTE